MPAEDVQTLLRHIHVQSNRYKCTVIRCIENRCQAHFFPPSHIWQSPGRKDVYWTLLMMSFFCVSASEMQVSVRVVSSLQFATQVLCSQNVLPTSIIQLYHPHSEDHRKNKTLMEKKYHWNQLHNKGYIPQHTYLLTNIPSSPLRNRVQESQHEVFVYNRNPGNTNRIWDNTVTKRGILSHAGLVKLQVVLTQTTYADMLHWTLTKTQNFLIVHSFFSLLKWGQEG